MKGKDKAMNQIQIDRIKAVDGVPVTGYIVTLTDPKGKVTKQALSATEFGHIKTAVGKIKSSSNKPAPLKD